jgi:cytoskeletal protein RodZ
VSIGADLANARRRAGLTVTQVSQQTRIRESIIRDIEQGDFTACGGDFYARGHIRSIAGAIGTDPVPLISEYDADHGPVGPLRAADVFEPSKPIKIRERRSPSMTMIVVVVLLAIIGYASYRLVSSHNKSGHPAAAASTTPQPSVRPTPSSAKASPTSSAAPSDLVIKVAAGPEDCWVLLTRAGNGSQIFMGVVPAGSSMTWTEKEAVNIRLGNPAAIVLTVNGQRQPIKTILPVTLSYRPQGSSSLAAQPGASSTALSG